MIHHLISSFIASENLLNATDRPLVALSGGADSVALLRLLLQLGYQCQAAHCNFHLRGNESDRDEQFVRNLCIELNTPLHVAQFDTQMYAASHKVSIEMAARELRYQWFEELRKQTGCTCIAVAHHQDDSVETILLNLIRGTGLNGLTGIQSKNGYVVRPLLTISRKQIIDYLHNIRQPYVTDSTNLQDEYTRNKIRLNILPLMAELNPSVHESIATTGRYVNSALKIYQHGIEQSKTRVLQQQSVDLDALKQELSPESVLHEILYPLGFNSSQINDIITSIDGQSGKVFYGKNDWQAVKDRRRLIITKATQNSNPPFVLIYKEVENKPDYQISRDRTVACLDADKLKGEFKLRKWQQGDRFFPFGMKGQKLVSDYMTDRKFSISKKENQWLLCSDEEIVWVVGERTDNRFRIDTNTQRIIEIRMKQNNEEQL